MQYVEGPRDAIYALQEDLMQDPRHVEFEVLAEGPVEDRQFPDWSMGYAEFDEADRLKRTFLTAVTPATESRGAIPPLLACMKEIAAKRGERSGRAVWI